jgi:Transposase DDE domain/SWIM zinc finger
MIDLPPKRTTREIRALGMIQADHRVAKALGTSGEYVVPSQAGRGLYRVRIGNPPGTSDTCTCADFEERHAPCKHIYLVRLDGKFEGMPLPSYGFGTHSPPSPPKRNWALYNRGQMEEGRLVKKLLRDLANGFSEPHKDPKRAGRKPVPLRDQAFCAVLRSYYGFSLRRSHDFRQMAVEKEFLSSSHSYSLVSHFLNRADVTEGLHDMLARSAIPLIGLENTCAIDSTGLRTSQFNYYRKEKYEPTRENVWLKLHALAGVKTHIIPVLEVTVGAANDCPLFPILLKRAAANGFQFKEVYADKAYQSRENFNTADVLEMLPFIPFKSNQTGKTAGSPLYHKMFWFFQYKREEFDNHYGQRAQVESTFGALKQKLSETLVSRKFTSQQNEILCLAIAHNIMVLIRQMFEADILPDFLQPPASAPANLPDMMAIEPPLFPNRMEPELTVPQSANPR